MADTKAAQAWLDANPNDPKAPAVRAKLQALAAGGGGGAQPPPGDNRGVLEKYLALLGRGSPKGGAAGGIIGQIAGGPLAGAAGAFVGNLAGQNPLSSAEQGLNPQPLAGRPSPRPFPGGYAAARSQQGGQIDASRSFAPDYAAAAADAGTQLGAGLALKPLGMAAAKLGFPRVAGVLGAKTPQQAVLDVAPKGATSISTPALQRIESTAAVEGAPAAKLMGATDAELSRQEVGMARLAEKSKGSMGGIQSRMAARDTSELLPKTQAFSKSLDAANIPDDVRRAAFSDAPSIEEAAVNPGVRSARQDLVTAAVPQRADANALKNASRFIANAEARGVTGPSSRYAGEASGLTALTGTAPANVEWLNSLGPKGAAARAVSSMLPKGGLSPERVVQTTGALLGSRGEQLMDPALQRILSNNPAYKGSPLPQGVEDLLRRFGDR